ncbi:MAG: acyl-CoA desaturase [Planctomycetota bacterium]|nr:MAG: acyl-CoA desaturase [Planctomycetota bacterium]
MARRRSRRTSRSIASWRSRPSRRPKRSRSKRRSAAPNLLKVCSRFAQGSLKALFPPIHSAIATAPANSPPSGAARLPLPDCIVPGKIYWLYAIPIAGLHLAALLAFMPYFFSWTGLWVMLAGVFVFGQSITLCYHRLLAHKSAKVPKWFEHAMVVLALCSVEDTPGRWVATHRYHHVHSDEQNDPHSPLVAFLWAHVGWLLVYNPSTHNITTYQKYARDVLEDPFYLKLEKSSAWVWIYLVQAALYFAVGACFSIEMGWSLLIWGVVVRTVIVWHITWSVNSLTHMFGYSSYGTDDHSRNNWFVALLTSGEGWHNNHHHDPASASNQHRWWEIDVTYYLIKMLEFIGIATEVTPPRHKRMAMQAERAIRENSVTNA